MLHECSLNCHSIEISKAESLGIKDEGKWMPFIFHMDMVEAAKLTSEDEDTNVIGCTTIFSKTGDAYIIDTPYRDFFDLLKQYHEEESNSSENDLEL
jgi:hypothetical protein